MQGESSTNDFILDASTNRLLHLFSRNDRNDEVVEEMICLVQEKAPHLLEGLSNALKEEIFQTMSLQCYYKDQVIFRQGDAPDAFYTVIHGAVSLYSDCGPLDDDTTSNKNQEDRNQYGKFLMRLEAGSSFGELSFSADYNHVPRKAGVISDGHYGQAQVQINSVDGVKEVESSNIAVLLLIPEKTYMEFLFTIHMTKHQTRNKISCLRKSFLFHSWPMDQLVKLAYTMTRKVYPEGSTIRQQGERLDHIILLDKGELLVRQTIATALSSTMDSEISGSIIIQKSKNGKRYKQCPIVVDIAELRHHDLFGVVEYVSKSKKYKRQLLAKTMVEAYFIPIANFHSIMKQEPQTAKMIQELARRRMKWEEVRRDFAIHFFPSFDVSVPKHGYKISQYSSWSLKGKKGKHLEIHGGKEKIRQKEQEQLV